MKPVIQSVKLFLFVCLQEDLIHLGAKYSPCMRKDENVQAAIALDDDRERQNACCVRSVGSGCFMTNEAGCPVS